MTRTRKPSPQTRAVLDALLQSPRAWRHGYEISGATGLKSGTLYPILIRLADLGLLDSDWRENARSGRPPRHVYRLTTSGAAYARQFAADATPAARGREALA